MRLDASSATQLDLAERIESVKAGIIGAIAILLGYAAVSLLHQFRPVALGQIFGQVEDWLWLEWLIGGAFVAASGFLFGITYRYVIRQDANLHLRSGAVLAFGLVRGFAQIEAQLAQPIVWLCILVAESIVMFAIARFGLDWAMMQNWLRPFPSHNASERS